jgi:PST family polysaccharide transporter
MSTERTAARGAAWTIGSSLLSRGLSLVGTLLLIRFVVPTDYGEVSAATVVVGTINQITTLGVGIYVITNRGATREDLFHATFIHASLGVVAFVALLVLGKPLSPFFDTPHMFLYVPGLALSALTDRITFMPERVLIRGLRFRRVSLIRSIAELTYAASSLAAAVLGLGGMSIVVGNLARSAVRAIGMVGAVDRRDWLGFTRLRLAIIERIAGYGFAVTLSGLANFASRRWDNLLVARFFGPAVMGTYNLAYNLADIPAIHIGEQITDVMQASFAHMTTGQRRAALVRSLGVIGLVTFPIAVGLGVVAPTLADLFLDRKWAGAGMMLLMLSTLSIARPIVGATSSFLLLERGPRLFIGLEWLTLAGMLGLIATIGRISPIWTCAAVGIAFLLRALGGIYLTRSVSGIPMWTFLSRLIPPLLACVPLAGVVLGTRVLLGRAGLHTPWLVLALQIVAGASAYVGSAFLLSPASARDLLGMVRDRRRRSLAPTSSSGSGQGSGPGPDAAPAAPAGPPASAPPTTVAG